MLKTFGAALLLASGLAVTVDPALALQAVVTQVDKNTDGSVTYPLRRQIGPGRDLGAGRVESDR